MFYTKVCMKYCCVILLSRIFFRKNNIFAKNVEIFVEKLRLNYFCKFAKYDNSSANVVGCILYEIHQAKFDLLHFRIITQKLCPRPIFRISFIHFCGPRRLFCPNSNLRSQNSPHHRGPWCELLSSRADQPAAARDPPADPGQPISQTFFIYIYFWRARVRRPPSLMSPIYDF
jgi:hypothetical protein